VILSDEHRPELPAPRLRTRLLRVAAAAAAATIGLQIAYPLLDGPGHEQALHAVTVASVLTFALASLAHAAATRGTATALAVLLVAGGIGLAAEVCGVRTGFPFGAYSYAATLGPALLTVPLVVPPAWVMMAWPCLLLGRRLSPRRGRAQDAVAVLVAAWTLTAWDLFLDPQMTAAGHWTFADPVPGLPGTTGVPLTNLAGWFAVSLLIMTVLQRIVPRQSASQPAPDDTVPALLLGWTWHGSTLAAAAFFGRPSVAVWGVVAMGLPVLLWLCRSRVAT
jgi:putative membrane protein